MLPSTNFHSSVVVFAREAALLEPFDSLARAAEAMRHFGGDTALVTENSKIVGIIRESGILRAQMEGADWTSSIAPYVEKEFVSLAPYEPAAAALRLFESTSAPCLVIVDSNSNSFGVLYPSDLQPRATEVARPPMVGGMATPFGVYLTNGKLRAGAKDLPLVATGALLFTLFLGAMLMSDWIVPMIAQRIGSSAILTSIQVDVAPLFLFLLAMRCLPLAGTHAAEHKVVHAIERGEPLLPEVVDRMPRVHPRCGTNLAAAAGLFLGIMNSTWIQDHELRLLVGAVITLILWKPLGSLLQSWVTTRPPNAKQLAKGIEAGNELLALYQTDRERTQNPLIRIWASGMLHVMFGSMLMYSLLALINWIFDLKMLV